MSPSGAASVAFIDPATEFADGLRVLYAYHESFILQGQRLLAMAEAISQQGVGEETAAEAVRLAEYYDAATRLHHQDEERALFPFIVNKSFLTDGMIERLALDHEEIDEHWAKLNEVLRAPEQIVDPAQLLDLTARFEKHLKTHIERENLDFFPVLEKMLSPDQLTGIGQRMARLRE